MREHKLVHFALLAISEVFFLQIKTVGFSEVCTVCNTVLNILKAVYFILTLIAVCDFRESIMFFRPSSSLTV